MNQYLIYRWELKYNYKKTYIKLPKKKKSINLSSEEQKSQ